MSPMCKRLYNQMYISSTVTKLKVIVVACVIACIVVIEALL